MDACCSLMAALDKLVLVRRDDGGFVLGDEPPAWLHRLAPGALPKGVPARIEEILPFMEAFLPEAEQAWANEGSPRADSCIWTEVTPGGEELHLEATAVRVGSWRMLVITRNDELFLERRRVLQRARDLSLAHGALSREVERKDVLLHCIVHDLAGPLNSILGALSFLDEGPPEEQRGPLVQLAMKAALRQRDLIREILDTFAAERSATEVGYDDFAVAPDLHAAVTQVVEALVPMAASRGVRLEGPPAEGPPCRIVGDERRLSRVLNNLVDNAIRHTPSGKSVRVLVDAERDGCVVTVEDEGPGVAPAVAPRLFQKFARERGPVAGTGLGLYFCRITVENWGGAIGYEPRPEGGARFWVRLRRAPAPAICDVEKEGTAGGKALDR